MKEINVNAACRLKAYRHVLTHQQYQTLKGLILAGDHVGAMKGLDSILQRKRERNSQ
jgi:hypothetical protein